MSDNKCSGCGHEHDCEDMGSIIELTGENGEVINVDFLASIKVDDQEYAIMQALDDEEDDDEGDIIIMKMEYDDEEDEYYLVAEEDVDILERAFEAFQDLVYDSSDEDEDEE